MSHLRFPALLAVLLLLLTGANTPLQAADDAKMNADILRIQTAWENLKFNETDKDKQLEEIQALVKEADALTTKYPGRAEPLIWDGIVTSENAGMASMFSAMGLAKRARKLLLMAEKIDASALDAGAPTSLGVLYYRVPGFPVGFGDNDKARSYLTTAVKLAPSGMDANYFLGDFLYQQGEYASAREVFKHALTLPPHPDRPVWDYNRRAVIRILLQKIDQKLS
jgi:tetratricopeptide (TPR) repeat protein